MLGLSTNCAETIWASHLLHSPLQWTRRGWLRWSLANALKSDFARTSVLSALAKDVI